MELLRQSQCPSSNAWLEAGLQEFLDRMALQTPAEAPLPLQAVSAGRSLLRAMLQADRAEAIKMAISLQQGPDWPFAAAEAARQLRKDWQEGRIEIGAATQAFGALRSMLVYERADPLATAGPSILLYVPEREVHCVGAEILADRLLCAGAQVDLRMLCCRDLRASARAQQAFQRVLVRLETERALEEDALPEGGTV